MKSMGKVLACIVFAGACPVAFEDGTSVQAKVPYAETSLVADNIKTECYIDVQLAQAGKQNADATVNPIVLTEQAPDAGQGRFLKMEIVDAQSTGNAWTGHLKSVAVRGWLYADGQQVAGFAARRLSRGGFGAGFKGSCAVLERTVKAIGRDISTWLSNPVDGARLGDL